MNLNLNEQLLRDTKDAHICIFIANLASWLRYNAAKENPEERNYIDGRYWSYNTIKSFAQYFDFWSVRTLRTIIKNCQEQGLIVVGNFNKKKYDQTLWYTLTDKALEYYPILKNKLTIPVESHLPETTNVFVKNDKPIPELPLTEGLKEVKTSLLKELQNKVIVEEVLTAYHETLPDSPKIRKVSDDHIKAINKMIKKWPHYSSTESKFTIDSFIRYLIILKTQCGWYLEPFASDNGNLVKKKFIHIISDRTIAAVVNGEYTRNA